MINRRLRVGLVCNKDFFESDIENFQVARLREFAEFQWKEMNEPTGWEEMPDSSEETEAGLVAFASPPSPQLLEGHGDLLVRKTLALYSG